MFQGRVQVARDNSGVSLSLACRFTAVGGFQIPLAAVGHNPASASRKRRAVLVGREPRSALAPRLTACGGFHNRQALHEYCVRFRAFHPATRGPACYYVGADPSLSMKFHSPTNSTPIPPQCRTFMVSDQHTARGSWLPRLGATDGR